MHTIALTLAYDGRPFSGFAAQPGQHTVQGSLNASLELLYKRPIFTTCAGRTDAGVHALAQVVSFELSGEEMSERPLETLRRSLNALLDDEISVSNVEEKEEGFSARFSATAREYRYFIHTAPTRPVLISDRVWHVGRPLDLDAMRKATACLLGEHDFKSFCTAASAKDKPTCRNVYDISITEEVMLGEEVLVFKVVGNAFLHSMVRTLVGTLVRIGLCKREPQWMQEVLAARERSAAGETAPAQGLFFWQVYYDTDIIKPSQEG